MLLIQYPVHDRQNNIYVDYVTAVQFRMKQYISGTGDNSRGSTDNSYHQCLESDIRGAGDKAYHSDPAEDIHDA